MNLANVINAATAILSPRAQYARAVIEGDQRWSGADLKGKAKKFGASYARQRRTARAALHAVGGILVAVDNGLLVTAVDVGTDDFGNAIFSTTHGVAVQRTAAQARLF